MIFPSLVNLNFYPKSLASLKNRSFPTFWPRTMKCSPSLKNPCLYKRVKFWKGATSALWPATQSIFGISGFWLFPLAVDECGPPKWFFLRRCQRLSIFFRHKTVRIQTQASWGTSIKCGRKWSLGKNNTKLFGFVIPGLGWLFYNFAVVQTDPESALSG